MTAPPVSRPASCSFAITMSVRSSSPSGSPSGGTGAVLTIVRIPAARAERKAPTTASGGTSRGARAMLAPRNRSTWAAVKSGVSHPLAPGMTTMRLAPAASTSMSAVPLAPSTSATADVSMPSAASWSRIHPPPSSVPAAPTRATDAPARAAAIAWLSPLPPRWRSRAVPVTVSPLSGIRVTRTTRSTLRLPMQTTSDTGVRLARQDGPMSRMGQL